MPTPKGHTHKTVTLPDPLWEAIDEYRHRERIDTKTEAVRRLIEAGLRAEEARGRRRVGRKEGRDE